MNVMKKVKSESILSNALPGRRKGQDLQLITEENEFQEPEKNEDIDQQDFEAALAVQNNNMQKSNNQGLTGVPTLMKKRTRRKNRHNPRQFGGESLANVNAAGPMSPHHKRSKMLVLP